MQPTDAAANAILDAWLAAAGTLTVGLSETVPYLSGGAYTNITDVTSVDNPRVTVTTWAAATDRYVTPDDDLDFGNATDDFPWPAWILYEDDVPVVAGAITPLSVASGSGVLLPKASLTISIPA